MVSPGLEPARSQHHPTTLASPSAPELCSVSVPPLSAPKLHLPIPPSSPSPRLVAPPRLASHPPSHSHLGAGAADFALAALSQAQLRFLFPHPPTCPPCCCPAVGSGCWCLHISGGHSLNPARELIQRQILFLCDQHRSPGTAASTAPRSKKPCYLCE